MKALAISAALVVSSASVALAQETDLAIEMLAPAQADADTDVSFDVMITNGGANDAADVQLDDALPAGLTFVSMTIPVGWICTTPAVGTGGSVTCTNALLSAGDSAMFSIVTHIDAGASAGTFFTNIATVTTTTTDVTSENDASTAVVQTPPPPSADVFVTMQAPELAIPDTDVTYAFTVTNGSASNDATNLVLAFTLPGDLTFVSFVQDSGPTLICTSGVTSTCNAATFAGGASASFTVVGHVPASSARSQYSASVTIASDHDPNTENDAAPSYFCVQADHCLAGPCNANQAVVCTADQCHDAGTCEPTTGMCSAATAKADDTDCDDGNACTQTDDCKSGVCVGANPVVCPSAGQCESQGACNPSTGSCDANTPVANSTPCSDGSECTVDDVCSAGVCVAGSAIDCDDGQACTTDTCSAAVGCVHADMCADEDAGDDAGSVADAGTSDASAPGGGHDAGETTAGNAGRGGGAGHGSVDASIDASADGAGGDEGGDCSCRVGPGARSHAASGWFCLVGLALVLSLRRRRRIPR